MELLREVRRPEAYPEDRFYPCRYQPVNLVIRASRKLKFYFPTGLLGARRHEALHLARRAELLREVRHLEVSARRRIFTEAIDANINT